MLTVASRSGGGEFLRWPRIASSVLLEGSALPGISLAALTVVDLNEALALAMPLQASRARRSAEFSCGFSHFRTQRSQVRVLIKEVSGSSPPPRPWQVLD